MGKKSRAHAIIHGRVQGVCYRIETKREADRIGVCGWVRNRKDGTVEAVFEGDAGRIAAMLEWCKKGPPLCAVTRVEVQWSESSGEFEGFEIRFG